MFVADLQIAIKIVGCVCWFGFKRTNSDLRWSRKLLLKIGKIIGIILLVPGVKGRVLPKVRGAIKAVDPLPFGPAFEGKSRKIALLLAPLVAKTVVVVVALALAVALVVALVVVAFAPFCARLIETLETISL